MRKFKTILIGITILLLISGAAFAQNEIKELQNAFGKFSDNVAVAIPFNSTIGLNWSDAYIGQLLGVPPHFGFGISTGFTTLGMGSIDGVLNAAGGGGSIPSFLKNIGMPMPAYTVEGRIGGFILPFDFGLKFGILPLDLSSFALDYLLIGFDIRYAVIDNKLSPIKLSVGAGYNYLKGGIRVPMGDSSFNVEDSVGGNHVIKLDDTRIGFLWGTHCYDLKGQVSFKLPLITPYAGVGLSVAFSHAGYEFRTTLTDDLGNPIGNEVIEALKDLGISGISDNGFKSISNITSFNMRLFGGISFNMTVFKLDLTAMYNLTGGNFGATIAGRFQL
jgi:hypothetical protein